MTLNPEDPSGWDYAGYRKRANDPSLSLNEKCGFPEALRRGRSADIFRDIRTKLTLLEDPGISICDIGAGCSELSHHIVAMTARNRQSLTVIDSPEMLSLLPSAPHVTKIEGPFPHCLQAGAHCVGPFDAILAYSVAQTVFEEGNLFGFVDSAMRLLAARGQLLLGDIPNASMRKRFMASEAGRAYHKVHYSHLPEPEVVFNALEPGRIDDGVVLGLIARMRAAGLHAFVVPQAADLPMANRREDILIIRP
jgi:hypothetical protein